VFVANDIFATAAAHLCIYNFFSEWTPAASTSGALHLVIARRRFKVLQVLAWDMLPAKLFPIKTCFERRVRICDWNAMRYFLRAQCQNFSLSLMSVMVFFGLSQKWLLILKERDIAFFSLSMFSSCERGLCAYIVLNV
jgi:hypothetical protein